MNTRANFTPKAETGGGSPSSATEPSWTGNALGKPSDERATFARAMGTLADEANVPHVFWWCGDNNLWSCWLSKDGWVWSNLSNPGVQMVQALGTLVPGGEPHVFCLGDDGNIWVCWRPQGTGNWGWVNLGQSTTRGVTSPQGAIIDANGFPHVFVTGNDGGLWACWRSDGWGWTRFDYPSNSLWAPLGTGRAPETCVFLEADGKAWAFWKGDTGGWQWTCLTGPVVPQAQVGTAYFDEYGGKLGLCCQGNDIHPWLCIITSIATPQGWTWTQYPQYKGDFEGQLLLGVYRNTIFAVNAGEILSALQLKVNNSPQWQNLGHPQAASLAMEQMGTIWISESQKYAFFMDANHSLWAL